MKIAFFDTKDYDRVSFEKNRPADTEVLYYETHLSPATVQLAADCDAVCVFVNDVVDRRVLDELIRLNVKLVALRCAGYNNVDLEYARGRMPVVRVPAYSPHAVAEHAMALLLTMVRKTHKAFIRTRDFNFSLNGMTGFDLYGKTVGVVGTGRIGRVFMDICKGFGMHCIAYDPYPDPGAGIEYVSVEELWRRSDVISLHCPLTVQTMHLVNESAIGQMKPGVVLINTSRGGLVDSEALLDGIMTGKVGGACLDVYEEESDFFFKDFSDRIIDDEVLTRLICMPNVIVTSHQAFLTKEALENIAATTFANIREYLQNGVSTNEVTNKLNSYVQ